jgi:hypothetical protein
MMLRAKAAQDKAPMQVGMIKHQSVPKEKLSKAERKRQALEAKAKERDAKLGKKAGASSATAAQNRGTTGGVVKKREREESSYKGTARPTATPAGPTYKGTAGLASRRGDGSANNSRDKARSRNAPASRRDDYLGTDEEDEGEGYYDEDDYYSDESSDMEAGIIDVEQEEQETLQLAKREDEMELKAEMAAKKEKQERKRKLALLAAKSRR